MIAAPTNSPDAARLVTPAMLVLWLVLATVPLWIARAALYPYPESRTGEMAAFTVSPQVQGQGDGERILKRVEQRAKALGLESIFVLTTRTMHWFIKRGFVQVDADWLPEARKRKYNWDRRSQVFVKKLA